MEDILPKPPSFVFSEDGRECLDEGITSISTNSGVKIRGPPIGDPGPMKISGCSESALVMNERSFL